MPSIIDNSERVNLANKMWAMAYEKDGFRYFRCSEHGYSDRSALVTPAHLDCEQCLWIFYHHLIAMAKNEQQRQRFLDSGVQAVADAAQDEQAGKFDYQPYDRPDIQITLTDDTL